MAATTNGNKTNSVFWIGYSDLMTSLFFIMLVFFVVTIYLLQHKHDIETRRFKQLIQLEQQFSALESEGHFVYLPDCHKYVAKELIGKEIFKPNSTTIKKEFINATVETGKVLRNFLIKLKEQNPNLQYLLVIEGNMANSYDKKFDKDNVLGYEASYKRALAVYQLWNSRRIDLRSYNAEVLICGSGFNGLCRDNNEESNKRFLIQIIPKISNVNY